MMQTILSINSGSSSVKASLYAVTPEGRLGAALHHLVAQLHDQHVELHEPAHGDAPSRTITFPLSDTDPHDQLFEAVMHSLTDQGADTVVAVGHRVAHGGAHYHAPIVADAEALRELEQLIPLAPLHQPYGIGGIRALSKRFAGVPQIACFDTAFHAQLPKVETQFALPAELAAKGIRRYGFHGLSYSHIASVLPQYLGERADGRIVVAHLGSGASLCAMQARRSVATTMGFTALDGLVMGTRCGALDPGVILYLAEEMGQSVAEITDMLYHRSGLLGVSGESADMRTLLASPTPQAAEAVDLFCYRVNRELGAMVAALGGIDALVFTGGIGEHSVPVRKRIGGLANWLGVALDDARNTASAACISTADSRVSAWVIPTDEERVIAMAALAEAGQR